MPNERAYRVLALDPVADSAERDLLHDLGTHSGHDAKAAIEAALVDEGLPDGVEVCIGIPEKNWNEHDVAPDPRPQFKVTPRSTDRPASAAEGSGEGDGGEPE